MGNTKPVIPRRRWMARRQVQPLVNLTLLGLVCLTFASGWAASLLGLTEFGLHKYSSIALLLLATTHVGMHFRSLSTQLRHMLGRDPRTHPHVIADLRSD
jgi:hypothetical protein